MYILKMCSDFPEHVFKNGVLITYVAKDTISVKASGIIFLFP